MSTEKTAPVAPPVKKAVQKPLKLNNLEDVYSFAKKLRKYITDNKLSTLKEIIEKELGVVKG